jgi:hypothetical protein
VSAGNEDPTWTALVLEMVALRHQIAVLKRSGTRRPCFRFQDRLFWLLLARWWPGWRDSLVIVQPATILRWRREGWSGLWRYRSGGHWRGGRPRIPRELRRLIVRMARENFLWGAPRIHGELLMLGFAVSQATVSRYMPPANRRPGQSWRTFIRNQALAFRHDNDSEVESAGNNAGLRIRFYRGILPRFLTSVIGGRVTYDYRHPLPLSQCSTNSLRSQPRHRGLLHQARRPLAVSGRPWQVVNDRGQLAVPPTRSPPCHVRALSAPRLLPIQAVKSTDSRPGFGHVSALQYDYPTLSSPIRRTLRSKSTVLTLVSHPIAFSPAWVRF